MELRNFGPSLKTPAIGFGGGAISGEGGGYSFGSLSESDAIKVLEHAFERGIRLFDTAPVYGFGTSEKRIGKALSGQKDARSQMLLVSKLGCTWDADGKVFVDNSADTAWRMLEQSLKDLQTSYLDVYMVHWADEKVPVEKTMEELLKMKEQGLIRAIGVCNFNSKLLARARAVAPVEILQNNFCALDTTVKPDLFPVCAKENIGFMSYGTLAKGMLAGTVHKDRKFDAHDYRGNVPRFQRRLVALQEYVEEFNSIAAEQKITPAMLAVAWVLSHKECSVALCGSKRLSQIDEVIDGASVKLSAAAKSRLDVLAEKATPIFVAAD